MVTPTQKPAAETTPKTEAKKGDHRYLNTLFGTLPGMSIGGAIIPNMVTQAGYLVSTLIEEEAPGAAEAIRQFIWDPQLGAALQLIGLPVGAVVGYKSAEEGINLVEKFVTRTTTQKEDPETKALKKFFGEAVGTRLNELEKAPTVASLGKAI